MATFQDTFANTDDIASQTGAEVEGGFLINTNDAGTVAEFNGTTSKINIGSPAAIDDLFDGGGTAMAWVYIRGFGENNLGHIMSQRVAVTGTTGWSLYISAFSGGFAAISLYSDWTTTGGIWSTATNIPINTWVHVAVTYDDDATTNNPTIYINGVPRTIGAGLTEASTPSGTYTGLSTDLFQIGNRDGNDRTFNGYIAEVRVFKGEVLTDAQVAGWALSKVSSGTQDGLWLLDGDSNDDSGNGNNGTDSNISYITSHTPFYTSRSQTNSTDLLSGLGSTSVSNFKYTTAKKPGGSEARLQFSNDNFTTVKNANGDDVSNAGGFSFDGVNDEIDLLDSDLYTPAGTTMTTSAWVKTTKINSQRVTQFLRAAASTAFGISIALSTAGGDTANGFPRVFYRDGSNALQTVLGNYPIADSQWHHLVGVLDGSNVYFYVDGVLQNSASDASATNTKAFSTDHASIGNGLTAGTWFSGSIDDVRFYHIALSASEVWDLYSRHKSPSTPFGWWKLDGDTTDSGSGNNDGTASGATSITNFYELPAFGEGATEDVDTLSFDGTDDYLDAGTISNFLTDVTAAHSVGMWIRTNTASNSLAIPFGVYDSTKSDNWHIGLERDAGNKIEYRVSGNISTTDARISSNKAVNDGNWHHIVCTTAGADPSTWKIYVDGISQPITIIASNNAPAFDESMSAYIGARYRANTPATELPIKAEIANFAIWSDERTAAEVLTDFQNGYINTADANLTLFYPLGEGTGTTAVNADNPGTYDGTISGATWIKSLTRPVPATPTQQTIDISGLSFTDDFYVRTHMPTHQETPNRTYAFTEYTVEYTAGGVTITYTLPLLGVGT